MGRMVMQRIIAACDTVCHFHRFGYVVAYVIFSYKTVNAGFKEYLTHLRVHAGEHYMYAFVLRRFYKYLKVVYSGGGKKKNFKTLWGNL